MLTTFNIDEYVYEALRAGDWLACSRTSSPSCWSPASVRSTQVESLLAPTVTRRMIESYLDRPRAVDTKTRDRLPSLTARKLETLRLMARGLTNAEIASPAVCLRDHGEDPRRSRPGEDFGLRDRVQAVILAYETGLVTGSGSDQTG